MKNNIQTALSSLVLSQRPDAYQRLRDSMWLYVALVLLANEDGSVHSSFAELVKLTGLKEGTLRSWSGHLRNAGLVHLRRLEPEQAITFTVAALRPKESPPVVLKDKDPSLVTLATFVRRGLGDEDRLLEDYIELCEQHPREVILKAFNQVRLVPDMQIRKSRPALFNYLIDKYANKKHADKENK